MVLDPVLLCNDLGQIRDLARNVDTLPDVNSSGRTSMSIKESARIAQSNNFMGLICRSSLLVRVNTLGYSHAFPATLKIPVNNLRLLTNSYRMLFLPLWRPSRNLALSW